MNCDVILYCTFCGAKHESPIEIPGWTSQYESIENENALCPEHANIKPFIEAQCSNCVGGWGECDFFRKWAYGSDNKLSAMDLDTLRKGRCPNFINSCFLMQNGTIQELNMSTEAVDAGIAFANAITECLEKYKEDS